jgi:DHA1 family multidrug resistance protein-like MFS transporter
MTQTLRRGALRWEWLLALFTLASLVETIFWGQMSAFTPLQLPRLGVAPGQVPLWTGIITAVSGAFGIPFLPFWGALADRWARQPLIVRSFVAHLIAGVLAVLAGNVWVFLIGRAIMTLSLGNSGLMMTTLSENVPERRLGLAFAILNSAGPIGVFAGPLFGGPIVDRWGFQVLMLFNVAALLVIIALLSFGYRDHYQGTDRGPLLQMAFDSVRIVWRSPRLRTLFAALFVLFAGWIMVLTYVPVAVTALYRGDQPGSAVGLVLGAAGLAALVLSPTVGALADRYGVWRVLVAGSIVAVVLWPLPALTRSLVPFAATYALVNGVTSGVFAISFTALSGSAPVEVRGRVMSFAYLPSNLGSILGSVMGSLVTQISIFAVFPAAALMMLAGVGMLLYARRQGEADK